MTARGSNPWSTTMYRNPNNYFMGATSGAPKPCESCGRPITLDKERPSVYGSGRFCSKNCATLRTDEKHWDWLMENPEEYKKWQEWKEEREHKIDADALGGDRIFPI